MAATATHLTLGDAKDAERRVSRLIVFNRLPTASTMELAVFGKTVRSPAFIYMCRTREMFEDGFGVVT